MHTKFVTASASALLVITLAAMAAAQEPSSPPAVLVYHGDVGIKSPELLPTDFSVLVASKCKNEVTGSVTLSLVIDSSGNARDIAIVDPFPDDLDRMAIGIAKVDRFTPGLKDGVAINVGRELEITLSICTIKIVDKDRQASSRLRLKSIPVQKLLADTNGPPAMATLSSSPRLDTPDVPKPLHIEGGISPPVAAGVSETGITVHEQKARFHGTCLVSVVVDQKGLPHHIRVVQGLSKDLNERAVEAVSQYRFKPAMQNNQPVTVVMTMRVDFDLN